MRMMVKVIPCLCVLAAGCATEEAVQPEVAVAVQPAPPSYVPQVNTLTTANPVAKVNHESFKQVILDGNLPQWVAVQDVRRSRTNDGYERI